MKFVGIIPARYASTRLEGKPLLKANGKILLSTLSSETMIGANDKLYGVKNGY